MVIAKQNWEKHLELNEYFFDLQDEQVTIQFVGGKLIIKVNNIIVYNNIPYSDVVGFKDVDINENGIILTCSVEKRNTTKHTEKRFIETEVRTLDSSKLNIVALTHPLLIKSAEDPYRWIVSDDAERLAILTNPDGSPLTDQDGLYCRLFQTNNNTEWILVNTLPITFVPVNGSGSGTGIGNSIPLGLPPDTSLSDGMFTWDPATTMVTTALDDLNEVLKLLAPSPPPGLSNLDLVCIGSYQAYIESTSTLEWCVQSTIPSVRVFEPFYNGKSGLLTGLIDLFDVGNIILTDADDTGVYSSLQITSDEDRYLGVSGSEGFWFELNARIVPSSALTLGPHDFQITHSDTGDSKILTVYIETPSLPSVIGYSDTLPASNTRFISGVPSLTATDNIDISATIVNAVELHYSSIRVGVIQSANLVDVDLNPTVPPANGSNMTFTNITAHGIGYSENIALTVIPYNSANQAGTPVNANLGTRIDLVSNEIRVVSGTGIYPPVFGGVYDSTTSLQSTYITELQLLNGRYQFPNGNYTSNVPTVGPDYSAAMGIDDRYVTFNAATLSNASNFTITFNNTNGTWSGVQTTGITIHARIGGSTGWINCNSPYPGFGNPNIDGANAMVFAESTSTSKRVTLGSAVLSGTLYVRIGLPPGTDKEFESVTIS